MGCASVQPRHEVVAYQAPVEVIQQLPAGVPGPLGGLRAFTVTCATTATAVTDGTPYLSGLLWNNSATPVYLGAANVNTTTLGFPICTDTAVCLRPDMPADARHSYCRVASGTVAIKVLAGAM